jgi:hypothetical protein
VFVVVDNPAATIDFEVAALQEQVTQFVASALHAGFRAGQ